MRVPQVRVTIGQGMALVALAALNLAVARATPWEIASFPSVWVVLGTIEFVAFWKLILRRSLQAFHYTCLVVFVVAYFVTANLVATERLHPLGPLIRWSQQLSGEQTNRIASVRGLLHIGEFWMVGFLSLGVGCAIGSMAAWLERRRGWDIAAFWRGALIGFVIANVLATIDGALWGWVIESRGRMIGRLVLLGVCLIVGGVMGLSRCRSNSGDGSTLVGAET